MRSANRLELLEQSCFCVHRCCAGTARKNRGEGLAGAREVLRESRLGGACTTGAGLPFEVCAELAVSCPRPGAAPVAPLPEVEAQQRCFFHPHSVIRRHALAAHNARECTLNGKRVRKKKPAARQRAHGRAVGWYGPACRSSGRNFARQPTRLQGEPCPRRG